MTDGIVPGIPSWQPVHQVTRAGKGGERNRRQDAFEKELEDGTKDAPKGEPEANAEKPEPPVKPEPEDGTGRSLDVTA